MSAPVAIPFGLSAPPFTEHRNDVAFFFPGEQYLRALEFMGAALWTRTQIGVVTAEEGCGKSQVIRRFLAALDERVLCAEVHRQDLTAREFLDEVLQQFGVGLDESDRTDRRRVLERFLGHQRNLGRICLVVVENPQVMHPLVLDEIRALAEIEVDGTRALKLLLLGQSLLNHVVDSPRMGQLMGNGATRFHLQALSEDQVSAYVAHRLRAAGAADPDQLMPYTLMPKVHLHTGGVPAAVNRLCTQALACAAVRGDVAVTMQALDEAIDILGLEPRGLAASPPASEAGVVPTVLEASLLLATQGSPDKDIPFVRSRVLIGRSELADVRIDSVFVSRYHALIVREPTHDLLIDLGSTNGVLVNSRRVLRHVLRHRDLVQIGPARVTYLNPAATGSTGPDPGQTVYLARAGMVAPDQPASATVLAFGRVAGESPG
ncbi:MAG: AAA family ATPase [Steroidobacteraceae bacterium]